MNDIEMSSEDYFVGPKTHNRICTHTKSIFEMFDLIIHEVSIEKEFLSIYGFRIMIFIYYNAINRYFQNIL